MSHHTAYLGPTNRELWDTRGKRTLSFLPELRVTSDRTLKQVESVWCPWGRHPQPPAWATLRGPQAGWSIWPPATSSAPAWHPFCKWWAAARMTSRPSDSDTNHLPGVQCTKYNRCPQPERTRENKSHLRGLTMTEWPWPSLMGSALGCRSRLLSTNTSLTDRMVQKCWQNMKVKSASSLKATETPSGQESPRRPAPASMPPGWLPRFCYY